LQPTPAAVLKLKPLPFSSQTQKSHTPFVVGTEITPGRREKSKKNYEPHNQVFEREKGGLQK
jgi:hypothetical protein